jgi:hypothetical protein
MHLPRKYSTNGKTAKCKRDLQFENINYKLEPSHLHHFLHLSYYYTYYSARCGAYGAVSWAMDCHRSIFFLLATGFGWYFIKFGNVEEGGIFLGFRHGGRLGTA